MGIKFLFLEFHTLFVCFWNYFANSTAKLSRLQPAGSIQDIAVLGGNVSQTDKPADRYPENQTISRLDSLRKDTM
jgi:hypothetical protein